MEPKQLARIMKALSNPNRLQLYMEIARQHEASFETGHECYIADIVATLKIGAPTVSHHLKELANAGLIITERRGKYLVARVDEEIVGQVSDVLSIKRDRE